MNLYWFSDEDGNYWNVIAAKDEERAWQKLAECNHSDKRRAPDDALTVEEARGQFQLNAVTTIDESSEGEVASIFPLECGFTILKVPNGELSSLTSY